MNTALRLVYQTTGVSRVVNNLTITGTETTKKATVQRAEASSGYSEIQRTSATEPSVLPRQQQENYAPRPISGQRPLPVSMSQTMSEPSGGVPGGPQPMYAAGAQAGAAPVRYDQPCVPNYAWPSYAAYPNYAAVTYPRQYSPTAWPYIGPFYPYPQVPLGWRKVTLEWKDGWWFLDFKDEQASCWR
jgi:hypothetical protein